MDQRTHAWIAIRAIKLLEDEGEAKGLVDILKPCTCDAAIGAWIPDKTAAKLGGSRTENHIFKLGPYRKRDLPSRFILPKNELLQSLGKERLMAGFLKDDDTLDDKWWGRPYKADPRPGQHIANRAMALTINNADMLILGDPKVQEIVPGNVDFADKIPADTRCSCGQVSLFFFMLSHFVADALMPCHCDERDLADYGKGLHKELEKNWAKAVGTYFEEKNLTQDGMEAEDVLRKAIAVDPKFGIGFKNEVPEMGEKDVWEEIVMLCRGSFAVASIIAPPKQYPYKPAEQVLAAFSDLFESGQEGKDLLTEVNKVIMHDAVLNVAMVWKGIWEKFR